MRSRAWTDRRTSTSSSTTSTSGFRWACDGLTARLSSVAWWLRSWWMGGANAVLQSAPLRRRPPGPISGGFGLGEMLHESDFVARLIIAHLVDHPLADQQAEAAGPEAELVADVEVRERVLGHRRVRQVAAVEA